MQETGVKRLISVTGFGAGDSRNRGGCVYDTAFIRHDRLGASTSLPHFGGWR
jgi:hypothetical protein